eukprot:26906-Chlamydomonas_euryale.AAC.7
MCLSNPVVCTRCICRLAADVSHGVEHDDDQLAVQMCPEGERRPVDDAVVGGLPGTCCVCQLSIRSPGVPPPPHLGR